MLQEVVRYRDPYLNYDITYGNFESATFNDKVLPGVLPSVGFTVIT